VAPTNVNLAPTTGAISGDVIFEFSTPKDTFLDLYKTYMSADVHEYRTQNDTVYFNGRLLLPCMFQRAIVQVNGITVSTSNNYTQDGILSRRLQFGKSYNQSVNSMFDPATDNIIAKYVQTATENVKYIAKDTLDSLWIRQSEGLIVPPNSVVRFIFTVDASWKAKNSFTGSDAYLLTANMGPRIQALWMHPCYYVSPDEIKSSYRLRFVNINSFAQQLANGAKNLNLQYTASAKIVKMCFTMQGANYQNPVLDKRTAAFLFDNQADIQTLQFKHGNIVFPQTMYNFEYGLEDAYEDYLNHSQQILKDSGKEDIRLYANLDIATVTNLNIPGPVFVAPIVKDVTDGTRIIEINASFKSVAAVTYCYLSSLEAQGIEIDQSGDSISTLTV
jgi:hypothetical protein